MRSITVIADISNIMIVFLKKDIEEKDNNFIIKLSISYNLNNEVVYVNV